MPDDGVFPMSRKPPAPIDSRAVRRARARAAVRGLGLPVLAAEVAARMDERLDLVKIGPRRLLDAGCGTGSGISSLRTRYPASRIIALDDVTAELVQARTLAAGAGWFARLSTMLGARKNRAPLTVAGALHRLPLAAASVDLVWSNLALHRYVDALAVFQEMHRVLTGEGLLMFSTLGPDTLKELRQGFAKADPGWPHVHDFVDMHDLGDMLVASGFSAPVMDMETITLTYDDVMKLAADLQALGAGNALQSRRRGLSGRGMWTRLRAAGAAQHFAGRLPASFEIVYGHAWKPQSRTPAGDTPQIVKFHPSADLLGTRK
jgi:malonyl-CoA O-methyltransferase